MIEIALIDDHQLFRSALALYLTSIDGFEVTLTASNGSIFQRELLASDSIPTIVLTDLQMPQMGGMELVLWLRQNYPSIKIVVVSFMRRSEIMSKLFEMGICGYLHKGMKLNSLRDAIQAINEGNQVVAIDSEQIEVRPFAMASKTGIVKKNSVLLTERQKEFLRLCSIEHLSYKMIADQMGISPKTVDRYREDLFKRLNVTSRIGLVFYSIQVGLAMFEG